MAVKKSAEEKLKPRQFKDDSSSWWLNAKHYHLNENNEIVFIAGGLSDEKEIELLKEFCKRNKKQYKEREPSIFDTEEKEYSIVNFGKMSGKTTQFIVGEDKRYARWLYDNSADKKIKEELTELLKIKQL